MKDYKAKQKTVTSPEAVALGKEVERFIKHLLDYDEKAEIHNSCNKFGLTAYNSNYKPDLFLDDTLVEVKFSVEGNLYRHNLDQMATYYKYYKPKSFKLILVDFKDKVDINVRVFRVDSLLNKHVASNIEERGYSKIPALEMPVQGEFGEETASLISKFMFKSVLPNYLSEVLRRSLTATVLYHD